MSVRRPWALLTATAVLALLLGGLASRWLIPDPLRPALLDVRLTLPGLDVMINNEEAGGREIIAYSPDGRKVAYMGVEPENGLMLQDVTSGAPARQIALRGETPAFSPDSRFLAYASEGSVFKVGLQGEAPERLLSNAPDVVGIHWAADGYLYLAPDYATGILRVREDGTGEEWVATPDSSAGEIGYVNPFLLPDNRNLLYGRYGITGYELVLHDLTSDAASILGPGMTPRFVAPDIVVFAQGPRLMASRIDVDQAVLGPLVIMAENMYINQASFSANMGVSTAGDILYIDGGSTWRRALEYRYWDGTRETITPDVVDPTQFKISPDGRFIALVYAEPVKDPDIWVYDVETLDTRRVVNHPLYDSFAAWSADGSAVFFASERTGNSDLYKVDLASGEVELVYRNENPKYVSSVARNGRYLAFQSGRNLYVYDLELKTEPVALFSNFLDNGNSDFSPNSGLLAYDSNEFGTPDVFVRAYPISGSRHRITVGGGEQPQWSSDGRYIYFKKTTSIYRIAVNSDGSRAGEPERVMDDVKGDFELLPDDTGILTRTLPPVRSARLIQGAISRIQDDLR